MLVQVRIGPEVGEILPVAVRLLGLSPADVFDRADGRVIGVHIFGTDACELIHFGMELVNSQRSISCHSNSWLPHTYSSVYDSSPPKP